jgi:adenosylcobinamide-GDP ribazoletransferase
VSENKIENETKFGDDPEFPPHPYWADFCRAVMLLSRVPIARHGDFRPVMIARSVWCWPFAGLLLAGIAVLPALLAEWLTGSGSIAAIFAIAAMVVVTGALHEDGLADCADGFGGGQDRAAKLEIMRDSRIGSYGVVALILAFALRFVVLGAAYNAGTGVVLMVVAAVMSRAAIPLVMIWLPPARDNGLGHGAGVPPYPNVAIGLAIAFVATLWVSSIWVALAAIIAVALAVLVVGGLARWQIGGHSGDVLGTTQMVAEIFVSISFLAVAGITTG